MGSKLILIFISSILLLSCQGLTTSNPSLILHDDGWIGAGVAYGPYRDGQSPWGVSPSVDELREDLHIISQTWRWMRLYGSRGVTKDILDIIKKDKLDIKVMLGAWIAKEEGILDAEESNKQEIKEAILLANSYPDIVNSINIGNETMVFWSDHKVNIETMKKYIQYASDRVSVPVSTADDFNFWNKEESKIIADVSDFIVLHMHPLWAGVHQTEALEWVQRIFSEIQEFHPAKQIVIGETGWATNRHSEGLQAELIKGDATEANQSNYFIEFTDWAIKNSIPHHFFEVFDEKWKGGSHPDEVEKHWGLYYSDRKPKKAIR